MIDLPSVKKQADLFAIIRSTTPLKKVSISGGGEYAGPCPFCGGTDRFRVQPNNHRWLCRYCTEGKWDSVIGFIARFHHLDPKKYTDLVEICKQATGGVLPSSDVMRVDIEVPAYSAPGEEWQEAAQEIISTCRQNLLAEVGVKALDYLRSRGLKDETIERFQLGYSTGVEIHGLWVPRGIVIPCVVAGKTWYLKVRLASKPGEKKYTCVSGSRTAAIFNADDLYGMETALFCEGEFDCMISTQELGDVLPSVTFGSATNHPDLATWGPYLLPLRLIYSAYDSDKAGTNGSLALSDMAGDRVKLVLVPDGIKDINELHSSGKCSLWEWIKPYLNAYDPISISDSILQEVIL
jgi:DNA primase